MSEPRKKEKAAIDRAIDFAAAKLAIENAYPEQRLAIQISNSLRVVEKSTITTYDAYSEAMCVHGDAGTRMSRRMQVVVEFFFAVDRKREK